MTLDVTQEQAVAEVVAATERELGPIDILVNNAGLTRAGAAARDEHGVRGG